MYFCRGELAEWSIAAVLKTVDCYRSGGSNPSLSAQRSEETLFSVSGMLINYRVQVPNTLYSREC